MLGTGNGTVAATEAVYLRLRLRRLPGVNTNPQGKPTSAKCE
jgi:hypothetical protein